MNVIREIAHGGYGLVQEVELDNGFRVAKKTFDIPSHKLGSLTPDGLSKLKARFKREVRIQRQLPSDLFIPVLDSQLDSDPAWFTMPLASESYREQIQRDRMAGVPERGPLADILNSLEELHRLDYRHRDLKPENILFHDGRWKLADFGLVLPPTPEESTALTRTSESLGTLLYAAPELLTASVFHNFPATADIYSFGCILHDLVGTTSRTPFHQCTAPGPLGLVIERCTQIDPTRRFQNIATLRAAVLHALSLGVQSALDALTTDWERDLNELASWNADKVSELLRYFEGRNDWGLFQELDEERLEMLFQLNRDAAIEIATLYCERASSKGFDFTYCDVIVGRLEKVFELGSPSLKAAAVIATAKMAANHNRWPVMRRLLLLCGPSMDSTIAERLSIDIIADNAKTAFRTCVEQIRRTIDSYHPTIQRVLKTNPKLEEKPVRAESSDASTNVEEAEEGQ